MSYKNDWEAILKLGNLTLEDLQAYSSKLDSIDPTSFASLENDAKVKELQNSAISDDKHITEIIENEKAMQNRANIFTGLGSEKIRETAFYRIFRAAVTNNKQSGKENDPLTSEVLLDPMTIEVLNLPIDIESDKMSLAKRIFIRSSYRKLASLLLETYREENFLMGTPGIGKSHFAIYFAYTLIQHGIPFILDTEYTDFNNYFFLYKPDGYIVIGNSAAVLLELDKSKSEFWYIVDTCNPRILDHKSIKRLYIDILKMKNINAYGDYKAYLQRNMIPHDLSVSTFAKVARHKQHHSASIKNFLLRQYEESRYFLPCWKLKELKECVKKCQIPQNPDMNLEDVYNIVGGVPKYVFWRTKEEAREYINTCLTDWKFCMNRSVFTDDKSAALFEPDLNKNLNFKGFDFMCWYVASEVCRIHESETISFMNSYFHGEDDSSSSSSDDDE